MSGGHLPVKTATREVITPTLRPNLLLGTEARLGARSPLHWKGQQDEQEEVKKQWQVGLVAAAPGPRPLASPTEGAAPGLPCSKTPPHSSDLRGRAALPVGRTARRPAPARSNPWRRGLAPGEGARPCRRKALCRSRRTREPGRGLRSAPAGPAKFTFQLLRKESGPSRFWPAATPRPLSVAPNPSLPGSPTSQPPHPPPRPPAALRRRRLALGSFSGAGAAEDQFARVSRKWAGPDLPGAAAHVTATTAPGIGRTEEESHSSSGCLRSLRGGSTAGGVLLLEISGRRGSCALRSPFFY